MTEENKKHTISLMLAEATQAFSDAALLLEAGSYKAAVSRAYYGSFHHARALLLTEGVEAKTHAGVQHQVHQLFVRTNRLTPEVARLLQHLEGDRLEADYEVASIYTRDMAADALQQAERYGSAIRALLSQAGYI